MKSKASLNTDKIKEKGIFYKQGVSKEKYPVFYLIARKYVDSEVDMDTLLYYILKVYIFLHLFTIDRSIFNRKAISFGG